MKGLLFRIAEVAIDAAITASVNQGKGNKVKIDTDALNVITDGLNKLRFKGINVSCEGERDNSAALIYGQNLGNWEKGPELDIVLDPVDGTQWCADGKDDWVVSIAGTTRNGFKKHFKDSEYINKYFFNPECNEEICWDRDFGLVLKDYKQKAGLPGPFIHAALLKRDRHVYQVGTLRHEEAVINFIEHCELKKCLEISQLNQEDFYVGSGGGTEAMIIAALGKASNSQVMVEYQGKEIEDFCTGDAFSVMVGADLKAHITYQGQNFTLEVV